MVQKMAKTNAPGLFRVAQYVAAPGAGLAGKPMGAQP